MSKTSEALRSCAIFNTHDILLRFGVKGKTDVAAIYYPAQARMVLGNRTSVYSPSHNTDPDSAWYDNKRKSFPGRIAESMPAAIAWASERYGITKWAACPTSKTTKIPVSVRKAALAILSDDYSTP